MIRTHQKQNKTQTTLPDTNKTQTTNTTNTHHKQTIQHNTPTNYMYI